MKVPSAYRWLMPVAALAVWPAPRPAQAHKVSAVSVVTEIDTAERTCKVELAMEVEPTGDPAVDDLITPEQAATTFATEALKVYFDDEAIDAGKPDIRMIDESDEDTPEDLRRKKVVATVVRTIPDEAENFLMYVDENTEAAVVMVVIKDGQPGRRLQVLYPGEFSNPVNVEPVADGDPFSPEETDTEKTGGDGAGEPESGGAEPEGGKADPGEETEAADHAEAAADSEPKKRPGIGIVLAGVLALVVIAGVLFAIFGKAGADDSEARTG